MPARVTSPAVPYLVVGGLCGLIWAASLRGWMSQLVPGESAFTWLTFALLLLPGVVVGVLLGRAAYLRSTGGRPDRRLVFAPVLFQTALLDPVIFDALIRTGQGGGAIWGGDDRSCRRLRPRPASLVTRPRPHHGARRARPARDRRYRNDVRPLELGQRRMGERVRTDPGDPGDPALPRFGAALSGGSGGIARASVRRGGVRRRARVGVCTVRLHGPGRWGGVDRRLDGHLRPRPAARRCHRRAARLGGVLATLGRSAGRVVARAVTLPLRRRASARCRRGSRSPPIHRRHRRRRARRPLARHHRGLRALGSRAGLDADRRGGFSAWPR